MVINLAFRAATLADIPAMSQIRLSVKENTLSDPNRITPQMYADYLDRLGRGWVCEADGIVVGLAYAASGDASIWALFVRPEFEGLGVASGLLKLAADWLFGLGHAEIRLGTAAHTRADRFYAAQGWTRGEMTDGVNVAYRLRRSKAA